MKKILVTGATGFIGANLVHRLVNESYQVHILKRKDSDIWRIKDIISKLYTHDINLTEKTHLTKLLKNIKPSVIFHLANLGLYRGIDPSIEKSIQINTFGTINLIESADQIDYECFINTGSSSEYGDKQSPMKETDCCEPTTNYALAKLAGTLYAQSYAKKTKKPLATLRIFSPFGPFDHPVRLITYTILKMLKGEKLLFHNPYAVRDYIFIEDVIDAYLLCIRQPYRLCGEIFNIGTGKQARIKDVIQLLSAEIGSKSSISWNNLSRKEKLLWQADIQKAKKQLGWGPKKTLEQGLKETINWFKQYSYLYDK